jgi:DNA-binding IclR family transcriptional regulator
MAAKITVSADACALGHAIVANLAAGAIGVVGSADRLLAPGAGNDLVRAVVSAARAISRDLGAGRGGVAALWG